MWQDARGPHLITRGNVDGILSAAALLAQFPRARLSFVASSSTAADVVRRDLTHDLVLADLGLTPKLARALNLKAETRQSVLFLDHHQQSCRGSAALGEHVTTVVEEGPSATSVVIDHFELQGLAHLGAVADHIEHCSSPYLEHAESLFGSARIENEARALDYAWRLKVEDDRFRAQAARLMAKGHWPTEVHEVLRRFRLVRNEGRFETARERASDHLRLRQCVAIMDAGSRKPNLMGFGMRAVTAAAEQAGATVAVLVNRRRELSGVSLRGFTEEVNLGLFIEEFTKENGVAGGGHPASAGARIHTRDVHHMLDSLVTLATA